MWKSSAQQIQILFQLQYKPMAIIALVVQPVVSL